MQLYVERDDLVAALTALRDTPGLEYQQLMEIAGVDYPDRGPSGSRSSIACCR